MTATKTSAILLAGGSGMRMQADFPKQFMLLGGKPVALHSFALFLESPQIDELVVVCHDIYQPLFLNYLESTPHEKPLYFATPGLRRQDSVYNGFLAASKENELICIHDSARPFISSQQVCQVLDAARLYGSAALAVSVKFTVKECCPDNMVICTPDRTRMREIQTPQALKRSILAEGFRHVHAHGIHVTDDTQLAELLGYTVKLVEGAEKNIKLTTPADFLLASQFINHEL